MLKSDEASSSRGWTGSRITTDTARQGVTVQVVPGVSWSVIVVGV
jgi:hypothetical protein